MIVVIDVVAGAEHGLEILAGRAVHVVQEARLLRRAMPAGLHHHLAAVGEHKAGNVERIAEGMFGNAAAADHAAA